MNSPHESTLRNRSASSKGPRIATARFARAFARTPINHPTRDAHRTMLALLASGIGILPLSELLSDRAWLVDVWLSMLVVVGPAALLRLRRSPSAAQVWVGVVLLVPWLTVRFVRHHAVLGFIPLRGTWHDVGALLTSLHHTTSSQAAPIHSTVAVRLALCALLALVAALVDLIAVVGRRGALAGIPLLVVFTVAGAVPRQVVSWWLFALSATAFLILLALDSSDDLHRWGHYVPRTGQERSRPSGAAGAISAQRIAGAAIALAVLLPIFVPADSRNLVANLFHNGSSTGDGGGFGATGGGSIDPFVALKGQLNRKTSLKLFDVTVRSLSGDDVGPKAVNQPFYLRTNVLSQFVGTGWKPTTSGPSEPVDATRFESAPGTQFPPRSVSFSADIKVSALDSNPPVFAIPSATGGLDSGARWSLQDQLIVGSHVSSGDEYRLTITQPAPNTSELRGAVGSDPAMDQWLRLPPVADPVRRLVQRLTVAKLAPYAKARAISDYFADPANGFSYSLATASGDSGDQLVDFLKHKVGYCQQYAAAMGVMLRLAGVPARIVLGYTHAVPNVDGRFSVTTNDAHAWVEAYFDGLGWIPFDPTPLAGISGGALNDLAWAPHRANRPGENTVPTAGQSTGAATASPSASGSAATAGVSGSAGPGPGLVVPLVASGLLALIVTLVLTPGAVRGWRRRQRLRAGRRGDTDALWDELSDTAVDLGYVWSSSRTPRQVAGWLSGPSGQASESLQTLAAAVERSRYAPRGGADADGDRLVDDLSAVRAGLSVNRGPGERLRSWLWPASLGSSGSRWLPSRWLAAAGLRRRH